MLKKAMFGLVKVSTCMNRPESAEFTMDGLQLKKTGKLTDKRLCYSHSPQNIYVHFNVHPW